MNATETANKLRRLEIVMPSGVANIDFLVRLCRNRIMRCPAGYAFNCPFGFDKSKSKDSGCDSVTDEMWKKHVRVAEDA